MRLTGKAKEQFEKWLINHHWSISDGDEGQWDELNLDTPYIFYQTPDSMQWGAYEDWADSVGIEMWTNPNGLGNIYYKIYDRRFSLEIIESPKTFKPRQEARNAAIEKLNEIINSN